MNRSSKSNNNEDVVITNKYVKFSKEPTSDDSNKYKGLRIHALKGLHEFVAELIKSYFKANGSILDLGSGSGAMSLRLTDLGFKVTAVDFVAENFKLSGSIPFIKANLNDYFFSLFEKQFDGIVAVEVIEHLENPRRFLRECYKLLTPGGILIVSTPNIDNPISKVSFVRKGTFMWFTDFSYNTEGHLTPISSWLLEKCILESGFCIEWRGSYGNPFASMNWKMKLFAKFIQIFSKTDKSLNGEILVAILRKPEI